MAELFARGGLDDELPGKAAANAFVKSGGWRRNGKVGILGKVAVGLLDFGESGALGFVGNAEAGEVGERGHLLLAAVFEKIGGEAGEVGF